MEDKNLPNDLEEVKSHVNFSINTESYRRAKEEIKLNKAQRIISTREELTSLVNIAYMRPDQIAFQQAFGVERQLRPEIFNRAKTFFLPPDFSYNDIIFFDNLHNKDFGLKSENGHPRFVGRYMYSIMDFNGQVMGLIGYDKHSEVKYLLSTTIGFGKINTFYGMWMMRWIYSMGFILVVEGIVDCLWLWSLGIPAIALNGNTLTPFVARILKRFGYYVLLIPDNDETGEMAIRYWEKDVPKASVLKIDLGNDIDRWRRIHSSEGHTYHESMLLEIIEKFKLYASNQRKTVFALDGDKYQIS